MARKYFYKKMFFISRISNKLCRTEKLFCRRLRFVLFRLYIYKNLLLLPLVRGAIKTDGNCAVYQNLSNINLSDGNLTRNC